MPTRESSGSFRLSIASRSCVADHLRHIPGRPAIMRILQLCILVLLGGFGAPFAAANDNAAPSSAPTGKTVSFLRLYTDANDVSHFAVEKMELKARGTEGI